MKKKVLIGIFIAIVIGIIIIISSTVLWYNLQLNPVDNNDSKEKIVEIEAGKSTDEILTILKQEKLIKNKLATKVYIKLNKIKGLQAGKYSFASNLELKQIIDKLSSGDVVDEQITITFLEGKNIKWIANKIAEKTNNTENQVYELIENKQYIQSLIEKYWFLTEEISKQGIYYPLEGYLYPETYSFEDANVTVEEIFDVMLKQTDKVLTKYKEQIKNSRRKCTSNINISFNSRIRRKRKKF